MGFGIKLILGCVIFFFVYAVAGMSTGCESFGDCDPNRAIDFNNPAPDEAAFMGAIGGAIVLLPFALIGSVVIALVALRGTASERTKSDADLAAEMGERGFGTDVFSGLMKKR